MFSGLIIMEMLILPIALIPVFEKLLGIDYEEDDDV